MNFKNKNFNYNQVFKLYTMVNLKTEIDIATSHYSMDKLFRQKNQPECLLLKQRQEKNTIFKIEHFVRYLKIIFWRNAQILKNKNYLIYLFQ